MDENFTRALHYGHVGRAIYLPEAKTWTFSRSLAATPSITYTGLTKTSVLSPRSVPKTDRSIATVRPADQKLIPNAHPDLAAHWSRIRDDAFSKFVTTTNDLYNPQVSSLLDLGFAVDLGSDDVKIRPSPVAITASVTGECGNTVSFRVMIDDTAELMFENSALKVPSIGDTETTEWSSHGAPILQICFARPVEDEEDKATWMAARLPDSTVVFHPLYQRDRVSMHIPNNDIATLSLPLRNSKLDANPVVTISKAYTGNYPHAGLAFNPWYQRQLAIVDTAGNWSIWEISGREKRRKANWNAVPGPKGSLPMAEKPGVSGPRHDGWAFIEWIADFSTILVADRRSAVIFQIAGGDIRSSMIELSMDKQSEWILDVHRSTQNSSHFFVLTTSRLLWYDMAAAPISEAGSRPTLGARLAWRHFRDPEDTTLRFSELLMNGSLYLVLYSRLAELVEVFPCPFLADEQTGSIAVCDPFLLDVPSVVDTSSIEQATLAHYSTFVFREVSHYPALVSRTPYNPGLTLVKLFWIDSSLAVHETIFKGPDKIVDEHDMELEENGGVLRLKRHQPFGKDRDIDEHNFVVDDFDESVLPSRTDSREPTQVATRDNYTHLEWTLNWVPVYELVMENLEASNSSNLESLPNTLHRMIEVLESSTIENSRNGGTSQTMLELCAGRPMLHDIDQSAQDLARLVSTALLANPDSQRPSYRFLPLSLRFSHLFYGMPPSSAEKQPPLDLLETYDQMVHEWLTDLPQNIPDLTRRLKERFIRGVALDLLLSQVIKVSKANEDNSSRAAESVDADQPADGRMTPSQAVGLHISSPPPVPSGQTLAVSGVGSQPDEAADNGSKESLTPAYSSLAAFTTFKEPRAMPRNVSNLLSHWQVGADPATYEWQKTSDMLDDREGTSGPTTPKHRTRKKRSQRTISQGLSSQALTPLALMTRTWGSQPEHPASTFPLPSSQPTMDEPMSQIERGHFGAREAKKFSKAKKKRRAAGF